MEELLRTIACELVEDKESVTVSAEPENEEGVIVYHLHVADADMGRVVGKQGMVAQAMRVVMSAGAARLGQKIMVEID